MPPTTACPSVVLARRIVKELRGGCGDNSCQIRMPNGMGTNGGCRCAGRVEDLLILWERGKTLADLLSAPDSAKEEREHE